MSDTPRTDSVFGWGSIVDRLEREAVKLHVENATLKARIAELEANARTDEILLEASQEATQRQVERVRELTEWRPMETAPDEYCLVAYDSGLHLVTHGMESDQVVGEYGTPICWLPLPSPKKGGE